tara:strand:- start:4114 stop:4470 length:357 start_codon:yes stop_codon:yes gene_type:complete
MTKLFSKLLYDSTVLLTNFITFGKLFAIQAILIKVNSMVKNYAALTKNTIDDDLHKLFESIIVDPCYNLLMKEKNKLRRKLMINCINKERGKLDDLKIVYEKQNLTIFHDGLKQKVRI